MPAFGEGTVYLRGQGPAQGRLNICAADQTLRFLDDDGAAQQLNRNQAVNYAVSETVCLYCRDAVVKLSKANLKKLFPDRKDDIDAYFKSGKQLPATVDEARSLVSAWIQ